MCFQTKLRFFFAYLALLYAFGLLVFCSVIPSWGQWYSATPYHREQADAFLRGELAISHKPLDLNEDLCWSEGGVHQVWGLGIPLWQLPFEALAKLFGLAPFPDRIALGLFIALAAYIVLATWIQPILNPNLETQSTDQNNTYCQWVVACGAVVILLFFAPIINLLRSRMLIYQEVTVYLYFLGIMLICVIVALSRNPKWGLFWLLCALAGLGALIRPTLLFYGVATFTIGALIMACKPEEMPVCRIFKSHLGRLCFGLLLFCLGGGLLFLTNYFRFGSGWEFGHRLNLQSGNLLPSVYSTRFDYPFKHAPLVEAARELFGALFQTTHLKNLNGHDTYAQGFFPGQSLVFRWHNFGFTTYNLSYAFLTGLAWLSGACLLWKWARSFLKTQRSRTGRPSLPALLILWSIFAFMPLAVFYLKSPAIASRYLIDFAPAFVAAIVGLWCMLLQQFTKLEKYSKLMVGFLFFALVIWQSFDVTMAKRMNSSSLTLSRNELSDEQLPSPPPSDKHPPNEYKLGNSMEPWAISHNGQGWDTNSGAVQCCAIFLVESPEFLELELAVVPGRHVEEAPLAEIQAKVGLEFLNRASITRTNNNWVIRFAGPRQRRYQQGPQPVFLALVPSKDLAKFATTPSPWILRRISWR